MYRSSRRIQRRRSLALLADSTILENDQPVAQRSDQRQLMSHEHDACTGVPPEVIDDLEDSRLHRHVERTRDFVAQQNRRPGQECTRQRDALPLPSGEISRQSIERRRRELDLLETGCQGSSLGSSAVNVWPEQAERTTECLAHREPWIQRAVGVLEDQLNVAAQ